MVHNTKYCTSLKSLQYRC